jgi:general secretion pathway protein D
MDIKQSVDNILAGSAGAGDVVTSNREINTTVMVDNGKTLVLGGLIKDDLVENDQRVPLLGDIPLVGALFRYKSVKKVKTNLMVFLRPVILRDERTGTLLTNSKYNYIRDLQLMRSEKGVSLLFDENTPMLPDSEGFSDLPPPFEDGGTKDSGDKQTFQYDIQKQKAEQFPRPGPGSSE